MNHGGGVLYNNFSDGKYNNNFLGGGIKVRR
jgi:hypothetical protein